MSMDVPFDGLPSFKSVLCHSVRNFGLRDALYHQLETKVMHAYCVARRMSRRKSLVACPNAAR